MAAKNNKLVTTASMLHTNIFSGATDEDIKNWLDSALEDWNRYVDSGAMGQVLFAISDQEIAEKIDEINIEYRRLYLYNKNWERFSEKLTETLTLPKELGKRVQEIQELINNKLEEL